jgi:predicted DNA-binding transcriptional regulator AlpA
MLGLITTAELLAQLRISMRTLNRMRDAGEFIAPVQISRRHIMWRTDDIAAWVASK